MMIKNGYSRYIPILFNFITILLSLSVFFLYEPEIRLLILTFFLLSNILLYLYKGDALLSSILGVIIALPFNITFLIPGQSDNAFVSGIYVNYLAPVVSILDIFILQLVLILLTVTKKFKRIDIKCFSLIIVYGAFQALLNRSLNVIVYDLRAGLLLLCGVLIYEHWDRVFLAIKKYRKIATVLVISLVIVQVSIGFLQLKNGNSLGFNYLGESEVSAGHVDASTVSVDGNLYLRAYGTFPHPNVLAGWLLITYVICLTLCEKKGLIHWGILLLSVFGIVLTLSQSALIVLILTTAIYWISKSRRKFMVGFNGILALMIPEADSITERLSLVKASLEYFKDNILTGVGGGNFTRNFYQYAPFDVGGLTLLQPVHNIFILFLIENGVLGVLLIGFTLYFLLRKNKINFLDTVPIIAIVAIVLIGSVDHYLLTLPQGMIIFSVLILLSISNKQPRLNSSE